MTTTAPVTDIRLDPALDDVSDRELLEAVYTRLVRLDNLVAKVEPMVEAMSTEMRERGIMGMLMAAVTGRG